MPNDREDLPITESEYNSDLKPGFTFEEMKSELWGVIEEYHDENHGSPKLPGDIGTKEIVQIYAERGTTITMRAASNIFDSLANKPGLKKVMVWDEGLHHKIKVLRKEN